MEPAFSLREAQLRHQGVGRRHPVWVVAAADHVAVVGSPVRREAVREVTLRGQNLEEAEVALGFARSLEAEAVECLQQP